MKLGVIGAGIMGTGIGQVAAQSDWDVVIGDKFESVLKKSSENLVNVANRLKEKGKWSQEKVR